jgi:hypothetical protein
LIKLAALLGRKSFAEGAALKEDSMFLGNACFVKGKEDHLP